MCVKFFLTGFIRMSERPEKRHIDLKYAIPDYLSLRWRILLAVVVGMAMLLVGKRWAWISQVIFEYPVSFLISALISVLLSFLLICWVHAVVCYLDRALDGWQKPGLRSLVQLSFGLILPVSVLFLIYYILIETFGPGMSRSGYARTEIWIVALLLLVLNLSYVIWYLALERAAWQGPVSTHHDRDEVVPQMIPVEYRGTSVLIPTTEIAYIRRSSKLGLVYTPDGDIGTVDLTVKKLLDICDPKDFIELRRGHLIHAAFIADVSCNARFCFVRLSVGAHDLPPIRIPRDRSQAFLRWYKDYNAMKES